MDMYAENFYACGIANVLQSSNGENGETWFTELSENKIGSIAPSTYYNNTFPICVEDSCY